MPDILFDGPFGHPLSNELHRHFGANSATEGSLYTFFHRTVGLSDRWLPIFPVTYLLEEDYNAF